MSARLKRGGGEASGRQDEWTEAWLLTDWANEPRLNRGGVLKSDIERLMIASA